ncbi:ATP-binding protein [Desulfovibrio desulfuricans]|uniref:Iron-sulfur cluster carrier protein n=1 Tax=Desulfovibrio desulfuricans TaxID=876 RepID=A0A4P7UJF5_DESDE|nr:Mrp/NBP35 family ATP-binding protein [Desulfovibrio desulfuricans]QCC86596.1 ATP-binding protein [Desulfovibrio desulfuricans]
MSDCDHQCGSCGESCGERSEPQEDFRVKLHPQSRVGKVIGIMSGKGGVGKSLVTSLLAVGMTRQGKHCAILDADITGPSIPRVFGLTGKAHVEGDGLMPERSQCGVDIMSMNLLLPGDSDAVLWRGPIIAGAVKQFWSDVVWRDVDYMFVDMPPGTGDVPLTVFQSLPVDGIVVVTSPQDLVSMIVQKAIDMARQMNIPILGLVENFSYFKCPDNNKEYKIFGESHIDAVAQRHGLKVLARLPIDPSLAEACDKGVIEGVSEHFMDGALAVIAHM